MTAHDVHKVLPWDDVTRTVAQAVITHLPDATATEAYYHLVVRHLAGVLWQLGAADKAVQALSGALTRSAHEVRRRLNDASATTREHP